MKKTTPNPDHHDPDGAKPAVGDDREQPDQKPAHTSAEDDIDPFMALRGPILAAALPEAVFSGFTAHLLPAAARTAGVDPAAAAAAFPDGAVSILKYWSAEADAAAAAVLQTEAASGWRIREKVTYALEARLAYLAPHKEAARRAAATLALPHHAVLASRLLWRTSDRIWRALGDTSTDFNFYSKRTILSGVWASTFARWLADEAPNYDMTRSFLAARIENVMAFEKAKAQVRKLEIEPAQIFGVLGKLRYPNRSR